MNKKDMMIIANLRNDARMPLTKMSRKTSIPVSTLFDRLKINEDSLILRHTSLLDFARLGYMTRANITLRVSREDKEGLKEYLQKHEAVNSVFKINNGFDFMFEGVFKQMRDMEEFMDDLENRFKIEEKKAYFIIEDVKREGFMSHPELMI